jgi:hypothetical protein
VRVADVEPQVGALHRRAITDALQLETLLEPLRNAFHHVRDQRARQAVQRTIVATLGRTAHDDGAVLLLDLHPLRHLLLQCSEGPVHHDAPRVDRDRHFGRYVDWFLSDSTHCFLVTRRSRRLRRRFLSPLRCGW